MDREKMANCRMMLTLLFHDRIHNLEKWMKGFFDDILNRREGQMETVMYYLQERSECWIAESILHCVLSNCILWRNDTWRPFFCRLVQTLLQVKEDKTWIKHKMNCLYLDKRIRCPLIADALPYVDVATATGSNRPFPRIDGTMLFNYIEVKDAASFALLINALPQSHQITYAIYRDAFQVCCEKNWYEGAKHCYEQCVIHRLFFNDYLIFYLLRYPAKKNEELHGFFVDHPSIFIPFLQEEKKYQSQLNINAVKHCIRTNHVLALEQCGGKEEDKRTAFRKYASENETSLSIPMIQYLLKKETTPFILNVVQAIPYSFFHTLFQHGDAILLEQVISITNVFHGEEFAGGDIWKWMRACPPHHMECYPLLMRLAFKNKKSQLLKPVLSDLLVREVPFVWFVLNFMAVERGIPSRNAWLEKHLCLEPPNTFQHARWDVLECLSRILKQQIMIKVATHLQLSIRQIHRLFPPSIQEDIYTTILKHGEEENVLYWMTLGHELEDVQQLPQELVKSFVHGIKNAWIENAFANVFGIRIMDVRVLEWFTNMLSDQQRIQVRGYQELFLDNIDMSMQYPHWHALYQWALQQWNFTPEDRQDVWFDHTTVFSFLSSSAEAIHSLTTTSFFHSPLNWSLLMQALPMKKYHAFYHEWFRWHCREEGNAVASYFHVVYYLCKPRLSTRELQHFHHLANGPLVSTMLTEPHYYSPDAFTLLHVACMDNAPFRSDARALLLTIPRVRQEGILHRFYADDQTRQIVNDIDTSRESAMHAFSPQEQAMVKRVEDRYGAIVRTRGVEVLIGEFANAMKIAYQKDVDQKELPFSYDALVALKLEEVAFLRAKASYHRNVWHTAARFVMKPNEWMHPHASWVCVDPNDSRKRWASFESTKTRYLFALYWLAATDPHAPCVDGFTVESRIEFFARTIALLNRAHNYDHATRRRKLPSGKEVEEEVDDGEGDRPSCSMGMERRLLTSAPGNPLTHYVDQEEKMKEVIQDTLRAKVRALSSTEQQRLIQIVEKYLIEGGLDGEEIFVMQSMNLREEEQEICLCHASLTFSPLLITTDDTLHCQLLQYIPSFYVEMDLNP